MMSDKDKAAAAQADGKDGKARGPLEGLRVLALEHFVSGPLGSMMLGDWGAEVIRIERPGAGDVWRYVNIRQADGQELPLSFITRNRNKKGITLEMKSARGREIFLELVEKADVVWENLAPDAMKSLGLDYDTLLAANPAIVYVSVSGFGHDDVFPSHFQDRPAFDFITQAMGGLMWLPSFGQNPSWLGFPVTDLVPGMMATTGMLLALRERDRTGKGQRVDLSMYDVSLVLNEKNLALQAAVGRTPNSQHDLQNTNQLGVFKASDGYIAIGVVSDPGWKLLACEMGRPDLADDPRLASMQKRTSALEILLNPVLKPWVQSLTRTEAIDRLLAIGIPAGPLQTAAEVLACPQLAARNMFVDLPTEYGPVKAVGNPIKLNNAPQPSNPPPKLSEHTEAVLTGWLGMDASVIEGLRRDKVI